MKNAAKNLFEVWRFFSLGVFLLLIVCSFSCKKTSNPGSLNILSSDETTEAAQIVADANKDLTKIKTLYKNNENKREELKKAMEANNADEVRKVSDEIVYLINDGTTAGKSAIEKIQKAREMQINEDYRQYLELKEDSLTRTLEAFENYRQAARALRDNYDPKNKLLREKIKEEFKTRSENYRKIMETARDYSNRANELAKDAAKRGKE